MAAVIVISAVVVAGAPARSWADIVDPVNCEKHPTAPQCVIDVITVGGSGGSGGSGVVQCRDIDREVAPCYIQAYGWNDGGDGCYYKPASQSFVDAYGAPPPPAAWYEGWCGNVRTGFSLLTRMRIFANAPGQGLLVREAVKLLRLPAPTIRVNPAPPAAQLVFVPTWLWVEPADWGARSATASVPGMSVTATATPTTVSWSTGDGATVTCDGPGSAWAGGTDPKAASPDCGHVYTQQSGRGGFSVSATITWSVAWVGGGASGTEPVLTSTSSTRLVVAESPTVITNAG